MTYNQHPNSIYDIESLDNISDLDDITSQMGPDPNVHIENHNRVKSILQKEEKGRGQKMQFNIKILDIKIAHTEYCKAYFRHAFGDNDLLTEESRFEVLQNIINYR